MDENENSGSLPQDDGATQDPLDGSASQQNDTTQDPQDGVVSQQDSSASQQDGSASQGNVPGKQDAGIPHPVVAPQSIFPTNEPDQETGTFSTGAETAAESSNSENFGETNQSASSGDANVEAGEPTPDSYSTPLENGQTSEPFTPAAGAFTPASDAEASIDGAAAWNESPENGKEKKKKEPKRTPEEQKAFKKKILKITGIVVAVIVVIVVLAFIFRPVPYELDSTMASSNVEIGIPSDWTQSKDDSGNVIATPPCGGEVSITFEDPEDLQDDGVTIDSAYDEEEFEDYVESLDGYVRSGVPESVEVGDCDAYYSQVTLTSEKGYVFAFIDRDKLCTVKAMVPSDCDESYLLTTEEIAKSVTITPEEFTVKFVDGDKEISTETGTDLGAGAVISTPDPGEKDGYRFKCWKDTSTGEEYTRTSITVFKDCTLSEQWSHVWTVTYVDGQGNTLDTQEVLDGETSTAPSDPTRDGYDFIGWDPDESTEITKDTTITAQWRKKPTVSQQNALRSAESYLSTNMAFSYSGLVEQLEYEGFSHEDATYAADNCGADWYEQAEKSAESYQELFGFSRSEMIEQLEYEGFTADQAAHGADSVGL
ncbi:MAG: Ltp family lipoprotein [Coriobacteriales bacterium]|jgi:uncharacterized repeat protein (TIGR02543 family)